MSDHELADGDLFENWNRYYDPFTGRYLQPEPLAAWKARAAKWPAYSYAFNNPLKNVDPTGLYSLAGYCPNWDAALDYARKLVGCTGGPAGSTSNKSCDCQAKIDQCTHGCDVCSILTNGTTPPVFPVDNPGPLPPWTSGPKSGFTQTKTVPGRIGKVVTGVQIDVSDCSDPDLIPELGRTLLHEALHVCVEHTATDIGDGNGLCDAKKIEEKCD